MRTKNFLLFFISIFGTSLLLIAFSPDRSTSIQNIVTSTHQHIKNLQETLRDIDDKELAVDEKYLTQLGFDSSPRLYPKDVWRNTSLPVIVTYVPKNEESQAVGLIISASRSLPNNTILVYSMGLALSSLLTLQNYCNSSRCQIINFNLEDYPSHVEDKVSHAFRPLIIQDALHKTGAVLFLESDQRLRQRFTAEHLGRLVNRTAAGSGVAAWPTRRAVTSLTHKKMFEYFRTDPENFQFQQMVNVDRLMVVNTRSVHADVMLPWIKCSLTPDCIYPVGAQSGGCRFNKKPLYRYSGCHSFDQSALNIVLGLRHRDSAAYTASAADEELFYAVPLDRAREELAELERNTTAEGRTTAGDAPPPPPLR